MISRSLQNFSSIPRTRPCVVSYDFGQAAGHRAQQLTAIHISADRRQQVRDENLRKHCLSFIIQAFIRQEGLPCHCAGRKVY